MAGRTGRDEVAVRTSLRAVKRGQEAYLRGLKNQKALSRDLKIKICKCIEVGATLSETAAVLGVTPGYVSNVANNRQGRGVK
jgi:hypothetical protein